jgi:hypothetical protein
VDPLAFFCQGSQVSETLTSKNETMLVVIDRAATTWDENSYFLISDDDSDHSVAIQWFESSPTVALLGQVIVVLRPKRILDENNLLEPWQMDD